MRPLVSIRSGDLELRSMWKGEPLKYKGDSLAEIVKWEPAGRYCYTLLFLEPSAEEPYIRSVGARPWSDEVGQEALQKLIRLAFQIFEVNNG